MFLDKTKPELDIKVKAHRRVRKWLKKHNLPLSVIEAEYDSLNGLYH